MSDPHRTCGSGDCGTAAAAVADVGMDVSDLQYLILGALRDAEKPLHGYVIHKAVERRNDEARIFRHVGQASVYKSLENLLRRGMIAPGNVSLGATGRPSREYILTDLGRTAIRCHRDRLERLFALDR